MDIQNFAGFPAGRLKATSIPNLFFIELLPAIDDLAEMKVTLYIFWLLQHQKRKVNGVVLAELLQDSPLLRGLGSGGEDSVSALKRALRQAVDRGTLLRVRLRGEQELDEWFFLNTESGRGILDGVMRGEIDLGGMPIPEEGAPSERLNIFALYEQNIGLLQPLIVEELEEAEKLYPADWIEEAFKIAVESNVRRWRYIRAILERWRDEGKGDEEPGRDYREDWRSYLKGRDADRIKH
jgi:DNA replication protein